MTGATSLEICRCAHPRRRHDADGLCELCDCAAFVEYSVDHAPDALTPEPESHPSQDAGAADEKRFPCGHDGCPATFTREDNRDRHRLTAHGAEPVGQTKTNGAFRCPECGKTFTTGKGVGGHRAKAHPKLPAAAKQGSPSQGGSSAAAPSVRPDDGERLSPSGTATPETPAVTVGDAPNGTAGASGRLRAWINLGDAGSIEVEATDASHGDLVELLLILARLIQAQEPGR